MELKIYKRALLAAMATFAISMTSFAQTKAPQTPEPPSSEQFDDKALQKQMGDLQKQMAKLQAQMSRLRVEKTKQHITFNADKFSKAFKETFKDFGKDFSGSFKGMVPDMSESFKDLGNHVSISSGDNEEYKKKVASGEIEEKVKNYSKTYAVDGNDILQISNSFGKITVNTWNRNEFKVDVQMKFGGDNADAVNDMLNGSSISDSKSGSVVSFKTSLFKGNTGRNNHQNIEINYTVYMPSGNGIDINNRFGGVNLPELSGKAVVKVSYGALNAAALTNSQNEVDVRFGDANITNFNSGRVSVSYGKLKTGAVNNIDADIKFSSIGIERLRGSADVHVKYGDGFRIGTIDKSVKNITVDASFTKINFDLSQLDNFNFDVTTKFGDFNYDDRIKITSKSPSDEERGWSSTKSYKGYAGNSNSSNRIVINASYTGVNFN
ncbi:hypothetical protein [Mucilaginibacter terrenus]|nr:hypothetical protein [Mucilaginibacter terrenus]